MDKNDPRYELWRMAINDIEDCVIALDAHMQTSGTTEEMDVIGDALIEDIYEAIRAKHAIEKS